MLKIIIETTWVLLPAIFANMVPVFAAYFNWLPALNRPLDGGKKIQGKAIFGEHKTWRGLMTGIIVGGLTGLIQFFLVRHNSTIVGTPYHSGLASVIFGALLAAGALLGDALKSFVKRRFDIASGRPWPVFDQIDFVLGSLVVAIWFVPITIYHVVSALIILGIGSYVVSVIGVHLHLKKSL
jgi:CDP-2,3-bis-(O-geranylgeranyl)-sn-glycerol synthase